MRLAGAALEERVRSVVEAVIARTPADLSEPLELDSLGTVELVLALEQELGVALPDPAPRTLAQALDVCRRAVRGVNGPALQEGIGHLQWLARPVVGVILSAYFQLDVKGAEHVPAEGAVVLASNHDSLLDIPFLVISSPRRVWFMAKRELFSSPRSSWLFHAFGGFPVDRVGPDVRAVRAGLGVLAAGAALGMYPEGTRSRDFLRFRPGAAWLALASGAPIVPVGIAGTAEAMPRGARLPRRSHVRVRFGEVLRPGLERDPRTRLERARGITQDLREAVRALRGSP